METVPQSRLHCSQHVVRSQMHTQHSTADVLSTRTVKNALQMKDHTIFFKVHWAMVCLCQLHSPLRWIRYFRLVGINGSGGLRVCRYPQGGFPEPPGRVCRYLLGVLPAEGGQWPGRGAQPPSLAGRLRRIFWGISKP